MLSARQPVLLLENPFELPRSEWLLRPQQEPDLPAAGGREVAEYFQAQIRTLADHPLIGEFRGVGLIGALEVVKDKATRRGRNPQTGEEIEISSRRILTFKPSQVLKSALNDSEG